MSALGEDEMGEHYVRPADQPIPEPTRPSVTSRIWNRLTNLMDDRKPQEYDDGRQPMIGFDGVVRQMFDERVQPSKRRRRKNRTD